MMLAGAQHSKAGGQYDSNEAKKATKKSQRSRKEAGELLLGVDLGTSSSKGVLASPEGEILATATRAHDLSLPRPGWAEHDAEQIWWTDFKGICVELLHQSRGRVSCICVSGLGPCLLPVDCSGTPLRPAILYGIDTRATRETEELAERYGESTIVERCGNRLTSQSVGPKLLWLRHHEPEVWGKMRYLLMAHTFVIHRLTGEYVLDHPSASACEPLYDTKHNRWIIEWAEEIVPNLPLPRLLWPAEIAGYVRPQAAAETGIPTGTPVACGSTDAFSEAVSVGVENPGDLLLAYGTTMSLIEILGEPLSHPCLWAFPGLVPNTYGLSGAMATSGALTAWLKKISGDLSFAELIQEAATVPPGSSALVILPYFAGERSPIFDPDARGLILGLTLSHGRGHLYRALLEATAYAVKHILENMHEAGGGGDRLVAAGGGTQGGLWTQIVSDVTGRTQQLPEQTIGASYGDALLAARAVGLTEADGEWNRTVATVEPQEERVELYSELYEVYRKLYPATRDLSHELARLQKREKRAATQGDIDPLVHAPTERRE